VQGFVAILEDNGDRVAAMRTALGAALPGARPVFFAEARTMMTWLESHLVGVILISLDHDLPVRGAPGQSFDCGTGRQVAEYLATLPPTCPIIVHSSNANASFAMHAVLDSAGWPCRRVTPSADLAWVDFAWAGQILTYLRDGWISA